MKNYFLCTFIWTKTEFKAPLMAQQSGRAMIGFPHPGAARGRNLPFIPRNQVAGPFSAAILPLLASIPLLPSLPLWVIREAHFSSKVYLLKTLNWLQHVCLAIRSRALCAVSTQRALLPVMLSDGGYGERHVFAFVYQPLTFVFICTYVFCLFK